MKVSLGMHPDMARNLRALQATYEKLEVEVDITPSPTSDSVFHRDPFAWTPYGIIGGRMRYKPRQWEPQQWEGYDFSVARGYFEGADILWVNQTEYVLAIGARTCITGAAEVRNWIYDKAGIVPILNVELPGWHYQHLLGVANKIGSQLFCVEMLSHRFPRDTTVLLPQSEYKQKNTNWVEVGNHVVINERCTETIKILEPYASIVPVDISELIEYGGGPACATGILEM